MSENGETNQWEDFNSFTQRKHSLMSEMENLFFKILGIFFLTNNPQ